MKYFGRGRKAKLYRQWVEHAGLPPEAVSPEPDKSEGVSAQIDTRESMRSKDSGPVRVMPSSSAVTHTEISGDMMAQIDKRQSRLRILYIVLGVSIVILCVGLVLVIVHSC